MKDNETKKIRKKAKYVESRQDEARKKRDRLRKSATANAKKKSDADMVQL